MGWRIGGRYRRDVHRRRGARRGERAGGDRQGLDDAERLRSGGHRRHARGDWTSTGSRRTRSPSSPTPPPSSPTPSSSRRAPTSTLRRDPRISRRARASALRPRRPLRPVPGGSRAVLVPRRQRLEVTERVDAQGEVVTPLDDAEIDALIGSGSGASGAWMRSRSASCSRFSTTCTSRRIERTAAGGAPRPSGVPLERDPPGDPRIRAHEHDRRSAPTWGPVLTSYLERLEAALAGLGLPRLHVMGSNGGVLDVGRSAPDARLRRRVGTRGRKSSPRSGSATRSAARTSSPSTWGGTTAKASLIESGRIETTSEYEVGGQGNVRALAARHRPSHSRAGHRSRGGERGPAAASRGSIPGGALRVGPESAGGGAPAPPATAAEGAGRR